MGPEYGPPPTATGYSNMRFLMAFAAFVLILAGSASAQDRLNGTYFGIDDAQGARIDIRPDAGGYRGTFHDPRGRSQSFEADAVDDAAEAVLKMDGRPVLLRIAPLPYGAQVSLVPFDGRGELDLQASRSLGFLREGVRVPEAPADFVGAPPANCQRVAVYSFLVSYQFWSPAGVRNGYLCLPERARTLMRFFPAVQLDVIWKVCLAPENGPALSLALQRAGVACPEVIDTFANMQRTNNFPRYKNEVEAERRVLTQVARCGEGYVETKGDCQRAAAQLKDAAVSLRTPAMVLQKYGR